MTLVDMIRVSDIPPEVCKRVCEHTLRCVPVLFFGFMSVHSFDTLSWLVCSYVVLFQVHLTWVLVQMKYLSRNPSSSSSGRLAVSAYHRSPLLVVTLVREAVALAASLAAELYTALAADLAAAAAAEALSCYSGNRFLFSVSALRYVYYKYKP